MKQTRGILPGILTLTLLVISMMALLAQGGGGRRPAWDSIPPPAIAAQRDLSLMLGRPTATGITVSVRSAVAREGYVEYGTAAGLLDGKTAPVSFPACVPVEILLKGLQPDTFYHYRLRSRIPGDADFSVGMEHSFHTQRAPGSAFTFAIQGDSHPERPRQHAPALYAQTLRAVAAEHPDFYMTIGDDFSVDTLRTIDQEAINKIYLYQRYALGLVGQSAPLFLVNGNHEQAAMCNLDGTPNNVAVMVQSTRNALFPQPAPDTFYTGDGQPVDHIGPLRDYYAWTWGDALFVVIDPYWHSAKAVDNPFGGGEKTRDLWNATLGDAQYQWLKRTLEGSTAKFKFVFAHHVLGTGRGGIEEAGLCEWGGHEKNGADLFASKRPGWAMPIHQLFVKTGVTIFFQGHDHIFVRQQLDGVVYQTLAQPADANYSCENAEAYRTGDKLPGAGFVRVSVAPDKVTVAYIRQYLPLDETADHKSGEVAFSYTIPARKP